ncbi:MAG: hypothetical protein VYE15_01945 [Myxococcota bacterium]|nr:hypothetical protein [Myxococcota bacterium]
MMRWTLLLVASCAFVWLGCSSDDGSGGAADAETPAELDAGPSDAEAVEDAGKTPDGGSSTPDAGAEPDQGGTDVAEDVPAPPPLDPPPEPNECTGNTEAPLQTFGGACCYTESWHPTNGNCVWYDEDYGDGQCLDQQCDTGICSSSSYCTKSCAIYVDSVNNHTGEPGPDGVADDVIDDCTFGAVDGPYGSEYHCINLAAPNKDQNGICRPGSTFPPCEVSDDCPDGEACRLLYILGETQARCGVPPVGSVGLGEACNSDPNDGPVVRCEGPLCYSFGCSDLCADDGSCATDTCVDGACSKDPDATCTSDTDCSAMYCRPLTPYSNSTFTDDFCWPRTCEVVGDCQDPDWFCRPFWNGAETVEEAAFAPSCRKKDSPDLANYGEPCGTTPDGTEHPACVWSSGCIDNYCSGPCKSDDDCGEGAECLLADEWNIDVDGDDETDTYVNVDGCQAWPYEGELTSCLSDADCPADHHCQYRVKGQGEGADRVWESEYMCRKNPESMVTFGQECGGDSGNTCASDLCLVSSGADDEPSMCSQTCGSAADCPDSVDWLGQGWKSYCLSLRVNRNQSLGEEDDVFVPYCWRTSPIGSLDACDEHRQCSQSIEYCRAVAIAGNPDEPVLVEHLCLDSSQGLDALPTKKVGEPCESWTECVGRRCLPDGLGGGYCSQLCAEDADCVTPGGIGGLECTEEVLVPRADPEHSGVTARCRLAASCLSCETDEDCGGDYQCVNTGGLGTLVDLRCASPCTEQADCDDPDHSCKQDISSIGQFTGKEACVPDDGCPQ